MARIQVVAALGGLILVTILGRTSAFLATQLNASDPDLVHILCPEQTTGVTRDHKWITREAIRRNIRQFFIDYPPDGQTEFKVSESATLFELYAAYYGKWASPARFMKAVNAIALSNIQADSSKTFRYDPRIQGDDEVFDDYHYTMSDRYPQILTSILEDDAYPAARSLLGTTFHSLQKFYAHSTWIESGNAEILEDLGIPGFGGFEHVAEMDEDVCTPCDSSQGECRGNVIEGAGLTSGYYGYVEEDAEGYLIPKPTTGGKCSHGGVLDDTAEEPAIGGINKDTASPCFSPHYYLHDQAAELAVQATDHYLSVILNVVDVDKYRRLFDLYTGSALSIVMDTTSSMGKEIAAVKDQVHQIIDTAPASLYVLVPFNDPAYGPVTETTDPQVILDAVDSLLAAGGGDIPELFWSGLQLALASTPQYGNIFCFTDAIAKDGEKMEGDIAVAEEKNIKVTMIFSGTIHATTNEDTTIDHYHSMCDMTGGLFIPSDKFDVDEITNLLADSVESTEVDIMMVKGIDSNKVIEMPIDDSVFDFKVQVIGEPSACILTDETTGTEYDLMDEETMRATPGVDVIAYTTQVRALRFHDPSYGMWNVDTTPEKGTLSITVQGNSTLSWMGGFSILDPSPPHPHYMTAAGRPLTGTIYYLDVNLVGYIESKVADVDHVEFMNITGDVIRTVEYAGEIDDEFYIRMEPLPNQEFYVLLYGHLNSGSVFCRLMSVLIIPVEVSVEIISTSKDLSARPGENALGKFLVRNHGLTSDFTITGTDEMGYMTNITSSVHIKEGKTAMVMATFQVPSDAKPGTVSTVTVTAASVKQTKSVNSAVTQFVVLPVEDDHDKPDCRLTKEPSCEGYAFVGMCQAKTWSVEATLADQGSGLGYVYTKPNGTECAIDTFTPGTTEAVGVIYSASCCSLQAQIIGVDMVGNAGSCEIDMGLLGGVVLDFKAIEVGATWVLLEWTLEPTVYDIHKYKILTNDYLGTDSGCREMTCQYNVTDLDACMMQTFELTPVFIVDSEDYEGHPGYTEASTLSVDPGKPKLARVDETTTNSAKISWIPNQAQCIGSYQVCVRPYTYESLTVCYTTEDTSYELTELEACVQYVAEITPVMPDGRLSSEFISVDVETEEGMPGAPRKLNIEMDSTNTATLDWLDPTKNRCCILRYIIQSQGHKDNMENMVIPVRSKSQRCDLEPQHNYFQERNLTACLNYTFKVYPETLSGVLGVHAEKDMTTNEVDPSPIETMEVDRVTETSMDVAWTSKHTCVHHYRVCYHNDYEAIEKCDTLTDTQISLEGLLECVDYHVTVNPVTPLGHFGGKMGRDVRTLELAPGEPQNLTVIDVTPHTIKVQIHEPAIRPQCAVHYGSDIATNTGHIVENSPSEISVSNHSTVLVFDKRDACTSYTIKVNAANNGGLTSDWVYTEATTSSEVTSEARDFKVESTTSTAINFKWFEPEVNGKCVNTYVLDWTDDSLTVGPPTPGEYLPYEVETSVSGLSPCTEYTFKLTPVTVDGDKGPVSEITAKTEC